MIHYLGAGLIQRYGSGLIKFLSPELRRIFVPNRAFLAPPGVTVSNFTQVPNVVVALSSIPVSNVGAATLSHDAHKLDHGKSQVDLINPKSYQLR